MHATTRGQEARIDLRMSGATLSEVFQQIEALTDYMFVYRSEDVKAVKDVEVDAEGKMVKDVLRDCLRGTGLTFTFREGVIVIEREAADEGVTLQGFVTDEERRPLPGVTVRVGGTTVGTATDARGWFQLTLAQERGTLEFSFVGYKKERVHFTRATSGDTLRVVMREEATEVGEVVVTGYGNVIKGNYTGAATSVNVEEALMAGVSSIDQMLQGVVPGMLVMNRTGLVGSTPTIRVRGTSTLLGSQDPVWVVDGVIQRDPQPFEQYDNLKFSVDADDIKELAGNAISWLNPNDIESITVLKDASATAIYGSQAANGVIVITTKKAQPGRVQVNYSGDFTIGQRPHYGLYDLMNSEERMQLSYEMYKEKHPYPNYANVEYVLIGFEELLDRYLNKEATLEELNEEYQQMARQNTDWFDILFRSPFSHSHNLSISGGSEKIQNRTSFSFIQEKGEAKGNDMTQFSATSNTTVSLWERVTLNLLLNGSIREVDGFAYEVDPFNYAYNTSRVIPCFNEDGSLYYHPKYGLSSSAIANKNSYDYNILNELANTGSESKTRSWGATFDVKWNVLPGLEYQGLFAYTSSSADTKQWASEHSWYITQTRGYEYGYFLPSDPEIAYSPLPMGGVLETGLTNTTSVTTRNALVYDRLFRDKHRMTLQLGIETNSVKTKGETNTRYGYMPDRGETFASPPATYINESFGGEQDNVMYSQGNHTVLNTVENKLSEYGSAVYAYDERYILNASARVDASNRFGQDKNKRFQPTWSVGVKWRVANERFAMGKWWLNNLDIYGSYGYQGNAVSSVSPYLIVFYGYENMFDAYGLSISNVPYPDLGWEKTKTWNIGVDASLLEGRLNFTFNYFRKTSDVLLERTIPLENGNSNGMVGGTELTNNGYDLVVNVVPVQTEDFTWQLSVNTSVTKNSVESEQTSWLSQYFNGSVVVEGEPYSTFYAFEFAGLEQERGQPTFNKVDQESVYKATEFLVKAGKFTPDFSGGFNTMFRWKNLQFYALFAIQWGGHDRLPELYAADNGADGLPRPEENASRKLLDRWRKPGDKTDIPSLPGLGNGNVMLPTVSELDIVGVITKRYSVYNLSDARVANTDFIRCRQLSLSYNFNGKWMERLGMSYFQLKMSMTNPFMWVRDKKWEGLDPETGDWPTRRVTSLSLQVMF